MTIRFVENTARMTALAERFAAEGQMSLNKLLEAAVYALVRRAAWQYTPEITQDRMQVELVSTVEALKESELSTGLLSALETGVAFLQYDKNILLEHAPDIFVCRTCGHAALGQLPNHCPDCYAWPGRFRKFVAFFNGDNQEPTNPMAVLKSLEESAVAVKQLTQGLSEEAMNRKPTPSSWSLRDHMAHFYDTQEMLDDRVNLMLAHDDPDLTAYKVFELATTETGKRPKAARDIVNAFCKKRLDTVEKLRSQSLKALYRTGWHPSFGQITILRQVAYMANHEQDHLSDIAALCHQMR